jgi:hypothetical protein
MDLDEDLATVDSEQCCRRDSGDHGRTPPGVARLSGGPTWSG